MVLWLKLFLDKLLKFAVKYWKVLLIIALVIGWTLTVYQWSMDRADRILITEHNKQVKVLNDKIKEIEGQSKVDADQAETNKQNLARVFAQILNDKPVIVPRDKDNKPLVCKDGTEIKEIYLGTEFSKRWNMINEEVNK